MTAREQRQQELDRFRRLRTDATILLQGAREDTAMCLDSLSRAATREKGFIEAASDVADGEVRCSYEVFTQSVERLRDAQEMVNTLDTDIADAIADLADDEIWKEAEA